MMSARAPVGEGHIRWARESLLGWRTEPLVVIGCRLPAHRWPEVGLAPGRERGGDVRQVWSILTQLPARQLYIVISFRWNEIKDPI